MQVEEHELNVNTEQVAAAQRAFLKYKRALPELEQRTSCFNDVALKFAREAGVAVDTLNGFDRILLAKAVQNKSILVKARRGHQR